MSALFGGRGDTEHLVTTQLTTQELLTFPRAEATREAHIANASHLPARSGPPGRGCDLQDDRGPNSGQDEGGLRGTLRPPQETNFRTKSFLPPFWWSCCPWLDYPGGRPRLLIGKRGTPPPNPGHQEPQSPCVALWVCLPPLPPTEKKQKSKLHYTWILSLKHDCWANGVLQSGAGSRLVQNKCRMNSKAVTREIMDHLTAPGKSKRSKTGWLRPGQGARGVRITESLRQARTSPSLGKGLHHSGPKAELRQKRLPGLQMHALPGQPLGNFRKSQ